MLVAVVGVCASGKTTLVDSLRERGINAVSIAQEHSNVKWLWTKKRPDFLVVLDAGLNSIRDRRAVPWGNERLIVQRQRLLHARNHADLYINTDNYSKEDVLNIVLRKLTNSGGKNNGGSNLST